EELHQFDRLDVWELVDRPLCTNVINLKWLWKNKRDEENTVIRTNLVWWLKVMRRRKELILKNLSHPLLVGSRTVVYCEEVYVNQPDAFVSPYHPDKVCRLKKVLYGLKQAPRAWYDELSKFLLSKGFTKAQTKYRSKVRDLMYLTASRPDIIHATCYCARYQAHPTEKHLTAVSN
nr:putative Gag-Pol polyprotein [Tanacetum cinerariifolium]